MRDYKIFSILAILSLGVFSMSCGHQPRRDAETTGATSDGQGMDVDRLLSDADRLAGQEITVDAVCTHICKHGGAKIFLMGSDDTQTIRCEAGKEIGKFGPECVNSIVRVTGMLTEQRIDEVYLNRWEARLKAAVAERHGDSAAGCDSEKKARGETDAGSEEERIANFRKRIAERRQREGKDYLSFYYIRATAYKAMN